MISQKFKYTYIIMLILTILLSSVCFATDSIYVWSSSSNTTNSTNTNITTNISNTSNTSNNISNEIMTTSSESAEDNSLNLESGSAILIDQSTGNVLYSHNVHEQLRPASVTKVMSILLIMEALDNSQISLEDQIPCSETAHSMGGSQIWLDTTETLSVNDMLKSICVVSANDYKVQLRHKKI